MGEFAVGLCAGKPMRIKVVGDLLETCPRPDLRCPTDFDVVVAAGDVTSSAVGTIRRLREAFPDTVPMVFVLGDREYHGRDHAEVIAEAREIGRTAGVIVLEHGHAVVGGVRFAGCTFWSDYRLHGGDVPSIERAYAAAEATFRDLAITRHGRMPVDPYGATWAHCEGLIALNDVLTRPFAGPTVVVTHHAPSAVGLAPAVMRNPLAPSMASHRDGFVRTSGASLWIHGHVPDPVDHVIGGTRVVAAPADIVVVPRNLPTA
jgi:hypothetical protein